MREQVRPDAHRPRPQVQRRGRVEGRVPVGRAGVQAGALNRCTYAEEDLFYSFRRTTHRKEADYGRQISAIVMGDE